ncbi:MAG TPA: hypothetical protein VET48_00685 [Steroidobacteraceae bacterium]|nr:hypothetical protein [Steroidobacteraceae bacterium]
MISRTYGEHGPAKKFIRLRSALLSLVVAGAFYSQSTWAIAWVGRPLTEVLAELRASGISLVYSSQVVTPNLRVTVEPTATQPIEQLREALKPLGLMVQPLGYGSGFAIVRTDTAAKDLATARSNANVAPLDEVKVYASRYSVARNDTNAVAVPRPALETISGSEQDALRALHYLPGTANNGVSALTHVRGGNEDETLVQFDGVELYNPVHLKDFQGLFGLLDGEFVQSIQFFSGGYPARYGNHTSGMVDIAARQTSGHSNLLGASMLYTRAITSGSFNDEQGAWLFGYRNSSLPQVLNRLRHKIGDPQFEDFVGRLSYDWHSTKLTGGALRLNDELQLFTVDRAEETTAHYHDTYFWLRLEHDFSDGLTTRWQFSQAQLLVDRQGMVNVDFVSSGSLARKRDTLVDTLLTDWTATIDESATVEWGARIDRGSLRYNYSSQTTWFNPLATTFRLPPNSVLPFSIADEPRGDLYSAYVSARDSFGAWTGELGVRWDDYDYIDQEKVLSPRLNLSYTFDSKNGARFSAGRFVQARSPNNLDITSLAPRFSKPESSRQFTLAFEHHFDNHLRLQIEAYTKHNEHVRQYGENILDIVTLAPELKIDRVLIVPQSSTSQGVELSLASAAEGPFNWWANYTWSETRDEIRGHEFPRSFDQPHALAAGASWVADRWQNSTALTWHTGWPYTPLQIANVNGSDVATLGSRNSERFNDFVSLDLRSQYQVPIGSTVLQMFVEVHNALNRANACCRQVNVAQLPDGSYSISVRQKTWLSLVPIAGIDWRF